MREILQNGLIEIAERIIVQIKLLKARHIDESARREIAESIALKSNLLEHRHVHKFEFRNAFDLIVREIEVHKLHKISQILGRNFRKAIVSQIKQDELRFELIERFSAKTSDIFMLKIK